MQVRQDLVKASLEKFAKGVVQQARSNLTRGKKNVTGTLYNSLQYEIEANPNSLALRWKMDELAPYWKFQYYGVQGKSSNSKAPSSPFKFGTGSGMKGGLSRSIEKWVAARRFQFRDKKGKFLSYDATAFLVSRSIYNKGIKTTSFFTRPFQLKFEQLPEELATAYALELAYFLRFTLQNTKELVHLHHPYPIASQWLAAPFSLLQETTPFREIRLSLCP